MGRAILPWASALITWGWPAALGELAAARAAYERALAIAEATYGPSHPEVANRLNNLGVVLDT